MIWLVSPYWLNLIGVELVDLLHMFLDVVCKSVYGERQGRENEGARERGREREGERERERKRKGWKGRGG